MASFDLAPEPKPKKSPLIWNILTVVVLLATCGLAYTFFNMFTNPAALPSLFRPQPTATKYMTPTSTITTIPLQPTWTLTETYTPAPSRTRAPTWTQLPGLITPSDTTTPTETPITETPTITSTPMPASSTITYDASTTIHTDSACTWMGLGGKVLDKDGNPLQFLTIQLGGTLSGKTINRTMLSGSAPAYGPSGFEFVLGDKPVASTQELWLVLSDNNGKALTDKIYFDTFTDCAKNLVVVVFTKNR